MVDGSALDYRPYSVTVTLCVRQPLQHNNPASFTSNIAVGRGIERLALPLRRQHHCLRAKLVYAAVQYRLHSGGYRQICFSLLKVSHRIRYGNQSGSACGVHSLCRSHQAQDEGYATGRAVQVRATEGVQASCGFRRAARVENQHAVLVVADPGVHAGEAVLQFERVDSRVLKRLPACLQHHALLWVQQFRLDG